MAAAYSTKGSAMREQAMGASESASHVPERTIGVEAFRGVRTRDFEKALAS
jgi:hypothetical protein